MLKRYWLGITLSAALAILLITLSLIALLTPNLDYGVVLLILLALVIGLPLCLALLLTWLAYRRSASTPLPAKLHAAMFLPTLAALSVLPIVAGVQDTARRWFSEAHPDIRELHVNLSGRPLWLLVGSAQTGAGSWPHMPLLSGRAFIRLRRYGRGRATCSGTPAPTAATPIPRSRQTSVGPSRERLAGVSVLSLLRSCRCRARAW